MTQLEKRGRQLLFALPAFAVTTAVASAASLAGAASLRPQIVAGIPPVAGIRDLGHANGGVEVRLAIVMAYRNEGELDQLLDAQGDESSPLYNHFLTADQFRAAFSPTSQAYARTVAQLQRAGFTVTHTYPNRTVIDARAAAPVVDRYFATEIHRVAVSGKAHYANARPAVLPAELRGAVYAVLGFDDIEWYKPLFKVKPANIGGGIVDTPIGLPLKGPGGGFGPLAFAQGYDMPVQHQIPNQPSGTTYDGTGRTAGIEIPGDPTDSDLSKFLSEYHVTRAGTTNRIDVDGGPQSPSGDTLLEAALDYQTIAGVAPGAKIDIYEFPTFSNQDVLDGYNQAVSDNTADTINSSFGACETTNFFNPNSIAKIFKQGSAQGQTFHASSGDSGTSTFGCGSQVSVLTPTDTPYTVSIGGTRLTTDANGNYTSETYWNDGSGAGGGGVSKVFALPKFQKKVPGITTTGRNVPDISFDASAFTGESIVFEGSFTEVGGTSLASPIFGGCAVEVEQMHGGRLKAMTKKLYKNWLKKGYGSGSQLLAHDVTTGTAFGILKPGPGYDLATGIGSLDCFVGGPALL